MSLPSGTRLGSYEITHTIGAGGMGEVYRARDGKLGRSVAIKLILARFGSEAEQLSRFQREAKVLASINHTNIATLFGMEEADGRIFLVMELVEGETLADRLRRGPLQIDEALRIAAQIAEALEAAHEKNIIHRDLKPANIKITPDDKVKVLDFGLAKALEPDPQNVADAANSPTLTVAGTGLGIILGTAAYMSPEQAKGLPADHRSDVFSFGVVLYEMLTARQPFQGETAAEILASVLIRDPELHVLPPDLNPRVRDLIRRCLDKSPKRRWQAMGDLRAEIEALANAPSESATAVVVAPARSRWRRALPVALASLVAASLGAAAVWPLRPAPAREVTQFTDALAGDDRLTGVIRRVIDISRDGRTIVFTVNGQLYLRSLASGSAPVAIKGTEGLRNLYSPVISPDGRHVAFATALDSTIRRVPLAGGAPQTICKVDLEPPFAMTWSDDEILFTEAEGVMRVSANGGAPERLLASGAGERFQSVRRLPGSTTLLVTVVRTEGSQVDQWMNAQVVAQNVTSGERKVIVTGTDATLLPTGHLLYAFGGSLFAIAFDPAALQVRGEPIAVVEGIRRSGPSGSASAWHAVSDTGTLAYVAAPAKVAWSQLDLVLVERNGAVRQLNVPQGLYGHPRASPDRKRIAVELENGKETVLYTYDLSGSSSLQRVTYAGQQNRHPLWTGDSRRIVFQSDRGGDHGLWWQDADLTSPAQRLTTAAAGERHVPETWHPKEDVLLFSVVKGSEHTLWGYTVRTRKAEPVVATDGKEIRSGVPTDAVFSPDGKWVAYASGPGMTATTIYVRPFPLTETQWELVAMPDGVPHHPVWSPDGTEIIYNARAGSLDTVKVSTSPAFTFGARDRRPRWFSTGPPDVRRRYDMLSDGRMLGVVAPGDADVTGAKINVVLNWFEDLKARVPASRR